MHPKGARPSMEVTFKAGRHSRFVRVPDSKNAGILFRFPHLFPYLIGYGRSSVTIFRVDVNIYVLFIAKRVWVHYRELICFSKNLILEQIEIFQFCLKIRHLWRLPHPWVGGWVVGWMGGLIGGVR